MLETIIVLGLACATVSTTVGSSALFKPFRLWVEGRSSFIGELISCPYCLGHWVAFALAVANVPSWHVLLVWWLAITAVSALVSGTLMRLLGE